MQNTTQLWLIAGGFLCVIELFLPTQFILFLMGLSALLVALENICNLIYSLTQDVGSAKCAM